MDMLTNPRKQIVILLIIGAVVLLYLGLNVGNYTLGTSIATAGTMIFALYVIYIEMIRAAKIKPDKRTFVNAVVLPTLLILVAAIFLYLFSSQDLLESALDYISSAVLFIIAGVVAYREYQNAVMT